MKNKFTAKEIIGWYNDKKRDLPWRKNNNFYKVWISEVMLQQTKIITVIPYYKKWINKFKNIDAVANANQNDILKAWEGLGYYARARNFHNACKEIKRNNYNTNTIKYNADEISPGIMVCFHKCINLITSRLISTINPGLIMTYYLLILQKLLLKSSWMYLFLKYQLNVHSILILFLAGPYQEFLC